ncbi:hypothetical protein [Haloarcula litorea]|uniref:hypothetical protein n=1 Tax=Haloarcula litorea TaxID=3032579 RepID=UPI0023E899FA|nr:hypothetical protein [Halomicroarcula sp. GDY20]
MPREYSPLHPRMRWPAAVSLVAGFGLGLLAVVAPRPGGTEPPAVMALPFGALAALTLYAVMYRNVARTD